MNRVYNFSAGPSMLPESVLLRAAAEMLDYEGSGQSVMEMSHRSKVYDAIIKGAESLLREVMEIPDNYKVLFLQGGASSQFAMVPLNLMTKNRKADYVLSGQFSTKAYKEAARFGDCKVVASSKEQNFSRIPDLDPKEFRPDADYFHICMNNTIYGTVFHALPETGDVPLVADISSCILSRPIGATLWKTCPRTNAPPCGNAPKSATVPASLTAPRPLRCAANTAKRCCMPQKSRPRAGCPPPKRKPTRSSKTMPCTSSTKKPGTAKKAVQKTTSPQYKLYKTNSPWHTENRSHGLFYFIYFCTSGCSLRMYRTISPFIE